MNYFIIGGDKKEYGPATADQIRQWLREGRASGDTLLRLETETEWKPLRAFAEFQPDLLPPSLAPAPIPPPQPGFTQPTIAASEAIPANVPVNIGHAFARAWHLLGEHFGALFGACLLVWMALTAVQMLPYVGGLLAMFLEGPLYGGLFLVFLKVIRTGAASPADVFAFSGQNVFMLIVTGLVTTILTQLGLLCCAVPGIYLTIAWLFAIPLVADRGLNFWQGMESSRRAITPHWFPFLGLFIISLLPLVVFNTYAMFRIFSDLVPHILEFIKSTAGAPPSPAQVESFKAELVGVMNPYGWWLLVKQALVLISMPLGIGSFAFVYEDFFGRKR